MPLVSISTDVFVPFCELHVCEEEEPNLDVLIEITEEKWHEYLRVLAEFYAVQRELLALFRTVGARFR